MLIHLHRGAGPVIGCTVARVVTPNTAATEQRAAVAFEFVYGGSSTHSLLEASAARRDELSCLWPTAGQVDQMLSDACGASIGTATELRHSGRLLGVYMTEPHHHYRFPSWQCSPDGHLIPHVAEILSVLRGFGPYLDEQGRTTGWGETEWFLSAHVLLDDQAPCDMLRHNPQAVLAPAQVEYIENDNTGGT